jgi:putative transposase
MKQVLDAVGMSRQAFWKRQKRSDVVDDQSKVIIEKLTDVRKTQPRIGGRKFAEYFGDQLPMGRDKVLEVIREHNMMLPRKSNFQKTTHSLKHGYFPNLIEGLEVDNVNQVWQSDITYIRWGQRHAYLAPIIDIYDRVIVSHALATHMRQELILEAIGKAQKARKGKDLSGLIFHTDRGSQFKALEVSKLLGPDVRQSMCKEAWQNAFTERFNGILKQELLPEKLPTTFQALKKVIDNAIRIYNEERPHWAFGCKYTPMAYSKHTFTLPKEARPVMKIYDSRNAESPEGTSPTEGAQALSASASSSSEGPMPPPHSSDCFHNLLKTEC